ncbi:MAG: filamentous hemagglutinin N-terminal domain-containing protein, partial [Vitreoscilla sp.]|nr:filamentous hemagglutinin N-terminal domain-containing protein [Polaromonas sp.]
MNTPTSFTSSSRSASKRGYRAWSVRTVVVQLSRKLKATYRIRGERCLSRLLVTLLAGMTPWAMADLPTGLNVVAGQATASRPTASSMRINQATDKAVLNWQTFNIGVGNSVQFVQPATTSIALNRIVGNEASSIYGSLSANGQVFLVNPAGAMFAPGAQVNVGGLVASSLGISNDDFMAGRYTFSGLGGGAVDNHGTINAARGGYVLLAAPKVTNTGSITADAGSVGLLAGSRVTLDTSGTGLVRFSVDAAAANAAITNSGSIAAKGGQVAVLASAVGDAMATVINQTGVIRADSAVERNGMIVLSGGQTGVVRVTGTLSAAGLESGQTGGTVHVLGDKVLLAPGATVDASGQSGGGTVLVGGDYQGSNASVQNASRVHVAENAIINADASVNGNGGKVIVWADGDTRFAGSVSARGGANGGDGGFVETSGKQFLEAAGEVNASAASGIGGIWLLDPSNVSIINNTTTGGAFAVGVFTPTANDATVNRNTIQTSLNAGTNVTINTVSAASQAGDITVVDSITKSAGVTASLTFNAAGSIFINNTVASTFNALNVNLNATSATTFSSVGALTTNGGNVSITGTGAKTLGTVNTSGAVGAGNLTIGTAGAVSQLASTALTIKGVTAITAGSASDITLNTATNNFSTVTVTSGKDVALTDSNGIILGASNVALSLSVNAGGTITQSGAIIAPALNASTYSGGSAITLNNTGNDTNAVNLQVRGGTVALPGTGNVNAAIVYTDANAVNITGINSGTGAGGDVTLLAGGALTQTGAINAATLTATTANAAAGTGLIT